MAADPERLLHALRYPYPWVSTLKVLYGCMVILTVAVGGLGLVAASPLRQIVESWINIHLLFELLLCTLVIARYRWCVEHSPRMTSIAIKELSRHLSRIVYLVLYGAIGFREIIALVSSISHGGAVDFGLFDEHFRNAPQSAIFNPRDDWQVFLASGLLALLSVRALAFALWRCSQFRRAA
jgi:cytochrome b561